MSSPDFQHLRLSMVKDVAVVEIPHQGPAGPDTGAELSAELALVAAQEWRRPAAAGQLPPSHLHQQHGLRGPVQDW